MSDRDFIAEMNDRITGATQGSGWVAAVVAAKLHAQLMESDPELLDGWLHVMAVQMLRRVIGLRQHRERTLARRHAGARSFAEATSAAEAGDVAALERFSLFTVTHVVDEDDTQKRACDMTGPDHVFVAENEYQANANRSLMLAAFHRAVAKKVGKRRTSDVFTEAKYEELYRSIVRRPGDEAA